jgi:cyclic pyranopterin monophosphate synthase
MTSHFSMFDIGDKPITRRRALATGRIRLGPVAFALVRDRALPKGDALIMAEIAGVLAAKRTVDLLPLCHPIGLDRVSLAFVLDEEAAAVVVYCEATNSGRTGVEMEALTGASVALLTIWDLAKPIEAALEIEGVHLLTKQGGKSGTWVHPDGLARVPERFHRTTESSGTEAPHDA